MPVQPVAGLGLETPLWRRIEHISGNSNADLFQNELPLRTDEARVLSAWSNSATKDCLELSSLSMLRDLIAVRLDASDASARAARTAQRKLGLLSPFVAGTLDQLRARYGADALAGVQFLYNGHLTPPMVSMIQILDALGLGGGMVHRSRYSGTTAMETMFSAVLNRLEWEHGRSWSGGRAVEWGDARESIIARAEALGAGEVLIVDKGGALFADGDPPHIMETIQTGRIRFLIHNTSDRRALAPHRENIWAVDLSRSLLKTLEARLVGEVYALIAAREARQTWGCRVADVPITIVGFGLLGRSIARALKAFGMSPERILAVDPDPGARCRASVMGCRTLPTMEEASDPRGIVFVATPGPAIDASNAPLFSHDTLLFSLVSGGKGVDLSDIHMHSTAAFGTGYESGQPATDRLRFRNTFPRGLWRFNDLRVPVRGPAGDTRWLTFANCGKVGGSWARERLYPLNLLEDPWPSRFGVTAGVVALASARVSALEGPGVVGVPRDQEIEILRRFHECGLRRRRPLDARPGDDPADLLADLTAFSTAVV